MTLHRLFALLLFGGGASARTGSVTGVITNAATGETISAANVLVMGTTLGAATDTDGSYTIENVPAGPQRLRVTVIGYGGQEVPLTVAAGQTVPADVALRADAVGPRSSPRSGPRPQRSRPGPGADPGGHPGLEAAKAASEAPIVPPSRLREGMESPAPARA